MARYNVNFELSVEDMALIEDALLRAKNDYSKDLVKTASNDDAPIGEAASQDPARRIHDLLGRLHNQKVFYRPKRETYIGG
ncbi:MAG: hypothetical protein NXH74_03570 [Rhodobacteraceae bacterium]|nr:hypothetical protein [Paracoccaceae bacterium]